MAQFSKKRREVMNNVMQNEVTEVAAGILRKEGMNTLTVSRIANEMGVSRGTLYNYFADRDALFALIGDTIAAPLQTAIDDIVASNQTSIEKLERIARAIFVALVENPSLVTAMFSTEAFSGIRRQYQQERRTRVLRAIQDVVQQGVDTSQFRALESLWVADIFLGAVVGLVDSMVSLGEIQAPDEVLPALMDTILPGLILSS